MNIWEGYVRPLGLILLVLLCVFLFFVVPFCSTGCALKRYSEDRYVDDQYKKALNHQAKDLEEIRKDYPDHR